MTETETSATTLTSELIRDYSLAALANASELIVEATLLPEHGTLQGRTFLASRRLKRLEGLPRLR